MNDAKNGRGGLKFVSTDAIINVKSLLYPNGMKKARTTILE
jgi:hypothetical protein